MRFFRPLAGIVLLLPAAAAAQDAASLNPLASLPKAALKDFVDRPLFEPSRHPPTPPAAPVVVLPPPAPVVVQPPPLRLIGIVEGSHSLVAIVHRGDTNATATLRSGDRLGPWTIEVTPTALRATNGDRAFDYGMFRQSQRQTPVPAAAAPMAPLAEDAPR